MNEDRVARPEPVPEPLAAPRVGSPQPEATDRGRESSQSAARNAGDGPSRTCFFSSFNARTLRLPMKEIDQLLVMQAVRESFEYLNNGQSANVDGEHPLVEYDRLLGIEAGNRTNGTGFLMEWKLTPEGTSEWVEQEYRNNPDVPVMDKVSSKEHPEKIMDFAKKTSKSCKLGVTV